MDLDANPNQRFIRFLLTNKYLTETRESMLATIVAAIHTTIY